MFQTHLSSAEVVKSSALKRTSGLTFLRTLGYETPLNDLGRAIAEGQLLLRRTIQVLLALMACIIWWFAPSPAGTIALCSLVIVLLIQRTIKFYRRKW